MVVVLWIPPVVEQVRSNPGNFAILVDYFGDPPSPFLGGWGAVGLLLPHFDLWHVVSSQVLAPGTLGDPFGRSPSAARGAATLLAWTATAVVAVRLRNRPLLALHGVAGAAMVVAFAATSRIVGPAMPYLTLWAWTIGVALGMAIVATAVLAIHSRRSEGPRRRSPLLVAFALCPIAFTCVRLATETRAASSNTPTHSQQVHELGRLTVAAIRTLEDSARVKSGRYAVTWSEGLDLPSAVGLVNELERAGLEVGVAEILSHSMTPRRTFHPATATTRVHLATGPSVAKLRRTPGAKEVAYSDPRSPDAQREYEHLRKAVLGHFRKRGRPDLATAADRDPLKVTEAVTDVFIGLGLARMVAIGRPAAVFLIDRSVP